MKIKEIRELTNEELKKSVKDSRQELLHLRIQKQTGQLEDTSQIKMVRRDIARKETEQTAREKSKNE
ncbi:MAG: 50S ribosomal protein L29 [Verrucomicrobiota bacterium]|nr:50S ribosomal protein L29 [Verrucomicrobiota bacterium]